jgi:hypothetical protein
MGIPSAEGAKCKSIPNVAFVVFNLVTLEEFAILILKCDATMMLFLTVDAAFQRRNVGLAN